jgi:integrase
MNLQLENLEKTYMSSMFVISHSSQTLRSYKTAINRLRKFLKEIYQIDELDLHLRVKNKEIDICNIFKEFVVYLDQSGLAPRTIRLSITVVKGYLRHIGIKIDSDDLKQIVKVPKIYKTREIPLDKGIILRLLRNAKPKLQLAILIAVATGMRIGEITSLRISDVNFSCNPIKVNIRAEVTKTRQARETFLTTESANALNDYLKRHHKWSEDCKDPYILQTYIFGPVFRQRGDFSRESAVQMLQVEIRDLVRSIPDLNVKNENGSASIHFHAFRKFFRTTVGNAVGRDFAEALMGHGFYMDTYYQLPEEKKREMFLQAEPYITISDFKAVENNFKNLSAQYIQLKKEFEEFKLYTQTNSIHVP